MGPDIYESISRRTGGNIHVGVVGPVRTGKSTLIKRFMQELIIPNIEDVYLRERARDELPQSASGRTIMTAEPKFVPEEAVEAVFPGGGRASVRFIDSVGYMVDGAAGATEDGKPRMVATPWFDTEVTLEEAARQGTDRIIRDHSTIAMLVTTDGSVTDLPRQAYVRGEEQAAAALGAAGTPYIIVLNCREPASPEALSLAKELEEKYGCEVFPCSCLTAGPRELGEILEKILYQFPVLKVDIRLPGWFASIPGDDPLRAELTRLVCAGAVGLDRLSRVAGAAEALAGGEPVSSASVTRLDAAAGEAEITVELPRRLFYETVSRRTGLNIGDDVQLLASLRELAEAKKRYDRIADALEQVKATGYGVVIPDAGEMELQEPEIIRQGGRYGVRLRASAPSIHMMLTEIRTEVAPIVGDEKQSRELLSYLLQEFDGDRSRLWESNIFGKSLHDLVNEGLTAKLNRLSDGARGKFQGTLEKVINEGNGTLICIML